MTTRVGLLLLAATIASLLVAIYAGYAARGALLDANKGIKHADEVKLAIDQCELALAYRDRGALQNAEAKVRSLTADDPREKQSLDRASALLGNGSLDELDEVFASMGRVEDGLMAQQMRRAAAARTATLAASILGGLLTLGFAAGGLAFVRGQFRERTRAEERLHLNEERFHGLVDAVTDYAIFMLDASGHVATWNSGAQRSKGYRADEIIGKDFSVFWPPEDRAAGKPEKILETVRREGRVEDEGWRVGKDGSRFWAHVIITALRDRQGEITGFAKVARDLTAKREAEQTERRLVRETLARAASETERQRLLTLLNQVPATINFFRGPDLIWEFVHPNAAAITAGRAVAGKPLAEALPEVREQPFYARLRRVYETGEPFVQRQGRAWHENEGRGSETYWDSVYLPVSDPRGTIEGVMTFELDVTATVRARQEMEHVNRAKDEFVATMSHELRTPLTAIAGWATILRSKPREEDKLERGLEVIERNAKAQTRMVNDLLDVSRIISGKFQIRLHNTEIVPPVLAAADVVRPAADAKGVRLVVDVDPRLGNTLADPDRLQQIVWNLLSNAVRFTPRGGRVTLTGDRTASDIVICVQDTGIGIAQENLPHVFERFMQVDSSTTRTHGGLGLGLAIVRHLVDAHGGEVEVHSEGLGRGARFTVTLPIRAATALRPESEAPGTDRAAAPPTSLKDVRVLLVEDDLDSLEVLRIVLETAGALVTVTTSARTALEAIDAGRPFDLIISDVGMPDLDGYDFMRRVRSHGAGAHVPAIALTAYARSEDAELAKKAGYQEHLSKPVNEGLLLKTVATWSRQSVGTAAPH